MARTEGTHMSNFVGHLRCLSSPPSGEATTGEMYFDTTHSQLRYYDGTSWIATGTFS